MRPLLAAEFRKVRATPTFLWLLIGSVGIGTIGTLAPLIAADDGAADLLTDHRLQQAMHGAAAGSILVIVAGIVGMAGEWRFGQATQTFLTTPQRWRVVAAKGVTYMGVGAAYGIVTGAAATATAWGWYRANELALPLHRSAVWLTLLGCLAVSIVFGLLGVAIGAATRNQVAAIVGALAWHAIVEPALFAASPSVFRWLPGIASFSLRRQPADGLLAVGPAIAVLTAFVGLLLAAGLWLVERDDVTA
jgi:ABC-2 type transport system permease protein